MVFATCFHRQLHDVGERQVILGRRRVAISVPGRGAVDTDLPCRDGTLQRFESPKQSFIEFFARDFSQLHFRIVNVVDVDTFQI